MHTINPVDNVEQLKKLRDYWITNPIKEKITSFTISDLYIIELTNEIIGIEETLEYINEIITELQEKCLIEQKYEELVIFNQLKSQLKV